MPVALGSGQAVYLVHLAAWHAQCLVMVADRLLVRSFQEAVDLAVGVVVQVKLPYAELVSSTSPGAFGYLPDSLRRELQVVMEIHELGHEIPPDHVSLPLWPVARTMSSACDSSIRLATTTPGSSAAQPHDG